MFRPARATAAPEESARSWDSATVSCEGREGGTKGGREGKVGWGFGGMEEMRRKENDQRLHQQHFNRFRLRGHADTAVLVR